MGASQIVPALCAIWQFTLSFPVMFPPNFLWVGHGRCVLRRIILLYAPSPALLRIVKNVAGKGALFFESKVYLAHALSSNSGGYPAHSHRRETNLGAKRETFLRINHIFKSNIF